MTGLTYDPDDDFVDIRRTTFFAPILKLPFSSPDIQDVSISRVMLEHPRPCCSRCCAVVERTCVVDAELATTIFTNGRYANARLFATL